MARQGTSRTRAPDIYEARSLSGWLSAVLAHRLARDPTATLSALAESARIPAQRLRDAALGAGSLGAEELSCLARWTRLDPGRAQFLTLLAASSQATDAVGRRRALDGLVGVLHERAVSRGEGAAFRTRTRWTHMLGAAMLRCGTPAEAAALARGLGVTEPVAAGVLADLRELGPDASPPDEIVAGPDTDLGTLSLADDLMCLGMRGLERQPERGQYAFAHQALPQGAVGAQRERVEGIHQIVHRPESGKPGELALLLTHSTPASHPVPARILASERP